MENTKPGNGTSLLTDEQRALRSKGIGASEIAAVCGVDPYRNALDIFLEKTGQVEPFAGNEATEMGNRLEPVIADAYADRMGVRLRTSGTVVSAEHDWMFATPDRLVEPATQTVLGARFESVEVAAADSSIDRGVECKNRNYFNHVEWGEPGTDEIPVEIAAQVQWSMRVTGIPHWDVAVLLGGNRLGIYHLDYDAELGSSMMERASVFWHDFVLQRVTPPIDGSSSATRYLNDKWRLYGDGLKTPTPEVLEYALKLKAIRADLKSGELGKAELENLIKDFIGDGVGIDLGADGKITWRRPKSSEKTNWRMVAEGLKLEQEVLHAKLVDLHTEEKEATRRFLPQFK